MKVNIQLNEGAIIPKKATEGAAAYDVYLPKDVIIKKGRQVVSLKFILEIPKGHEGKIEPRSGFSAKGMEGYLVIPGKENGVMHWSRSAWRFDADVIDGKIDSDYRGEVGVIIRSNDERMFGLKKGTRIAQLTVYKTETVEFGEFATPGKTERGGGGFGHTGSN